MEKEISQENINVMIALAMMKHLLNQGKISEKVYKRICNKYEKKGLEKISNQ